MLKQPLPEGIHPVESIPVGAVHEGLSPTGVSKEFEEERATETTCDELTTAPIPCAPALSGGKSWRNQE